MPTCDLKTFLHFFLFLSNISLILWFLKGVGVECKSISLSFLCRLFLFSTECDGNKFGQNCEEECGECVNGEQCHHINGTCPSGCKRGFQGLHCNQGKTFTLIPEMPFTFICTLSATWKARAYSVYDIQQFDKL